MGLGAVITGSSGFIGTRLARRLAEDARYDRIVAVDIAPPRERVPKVEYVEGDVRHPLPTALGLGVDEIYNLAAVHRTPGHPPAEYYDTNVNGALQVTRFAAACEIPTIVFTSSISVYGPSEDVVAEDSPLRPVSDYGRSKRMAELIHEDWQVAAAGRRLVIVRPGVVFGPGEFGNYTHLANALRRGYFAFPGRRDTVKSGGYVDELLGTFAFALTRNEPFIRYNFADPQLSTTEDIVAAFRDVAGWKVNPPHAAALAFPGHGPRFRSLVGGRHPHPDPS
ncbi:NAD(P)-dependent oxidoreductase [Phenylobacterium sp. J426]|uniref:NAD-dependent epimerase/dehydratase family protein n=1 Tax=Phenylobacterium sp. J426 TaxID=2898439 RepID=UPI002151F657|nr:NAD(P)-dependent oxidoreductase [Phenylobacterium sp. J426]MCR5876733.1 NAD(P)-dependent oxidoreductase [Phenylobacterium sp. J426]